MNRLRNLLLGAACLCSLPAFALTEDSQARLQHLQTRWAEINYQLPKDQREAAFAKLSTAADEAVKAEPKAAELLIWRGIILSTRAGAKGGLGALDLVKQAKASLESALAINPQALGGSAYTSLGSLYYQVPGWPLGFGNDKRAEEMLHKALAINPDGIDPNYFYGDYLFRQKHYAKARTVLLRALAAGNRPGRALADEGRRAEIRTLLAKVEAELD